MYSGWKLFVLWVFFGFFFFFFVSNLYESNFSCEVGCRHLQSQTSVEKENKEQKEARCKYKVHSNLIKNLFKSFSFEEDWRNFLQKWTLAKPKLGFLCGWSTPLFLTTIDTERWLPMTFLTRSVSIQWIDIFDDK